MSDVNANSNGKIFVLCARGKMNGIEKLKRGLKHSAAEPCTNNGNKERKDGEKEKERWGG